MNQLVLLLAAAALLSGSHCASVNKHLKLLEAEMGNRLGSNGVPSKFPTSKKFISLMRKPPTITVHEVGTTLELTCEALAAPAPSVRWFKNDAPVYEHDLESNEIIDTNPTSVARIWSTLLVPRASGEARYTCLVVAGTATTRASSVVVSGSGGAEPTERWRLVPLAPRVLVSYRVFVDVIGSVAVLPCRARGHPRPRVTWTDSTNTTVTDDNPRMKVLRSGELVVRSLRWSDMGEFTCRADNAFGTAAAVTFVYPARPSYTDG